MTEPTPTPPAHHGFPAVGSPLYAPALSAEQQADILERLNRNQQESHERSRKIDAAWQSPAARKIREIVVEDGNVEWPEFVKHCGGILEAVAMVDEYDLPDTDRIIPKVDELFNKYAQAEVDRGSVFRRRPKNRPYVPGPGTSAGEAQAAEKRAAFPGDRGGPRNDTGSVPMRTNSR